MEEFITDMTYAGTQTKPTDAFVQNSTTIPEFYFRPEYWIAEEEKNEFTPTDSVSPETMYRDFVTSLDKEELGFLAELSDSSEYRSVPSLQEIHSQMIPTLNMIDSSTGCSHTEREYYGL